MMKVNLTTYKTGVISIIIFLVVIVAANLLLKPQSSLMVGAVTFVAMIIALGLWQINGFMKILNHKVNNRAVVVRYLILGAVLGFGLNVIWENSTGSSIFPIGFAGLLWGKLVDYEKGNNNSKILSSPSQNEVERKL
jgi:fumarate hydratase class II